MNNALENKILEILTEKLYGVTPISCINPETEDYINYGLLVEIVDKIIEAIYENT